MFLNFLAIPARIFVYLALLSVISFVIQSGMSMGIRTLINKAIVIVVWAYVVNMVARSGGASFAVAWALSLIPFMPVGFQLFMF